LGKYHVVVENRSPYISQQLFANCINRLFLPFLRKVRPTPLLVSRLAVLLMDNCKPHMRNEVQKVLADYGVMMMRYAPYTRNIYQVLDISPFGIFKLIKSKAGESGKVHEITDHVVKVIRAIQRSCNLPNIQAAFRKAGFEAILVSERAFITFHEEGLRQTDGFRKTWDIGCPMEGLKWRRQESSYGFINSRFLSQPVPPNEQPSLEIFSLS
jgi:hypothetical protein